MAVFLVSLSINPRNSSHSTNSSFGTVKVPYQLKQSVGGSSGGSAAAVATGQCLA